jgi:hypothetical protein
MVLKIGWWYEHILKQLSMSWSCITAVVIVSFFFKNCYIIQQYKPKDSDGICEAYFLGVWISVKPSL